MLWPVGILVLVAILMTNENVAGEILIRGSHVSLLQLPQIAEVDAMIIHGQSENSQIFEDENDFNVHLTLFKSLWTYDVATLEPPVNTKDTWSVLPFAMSHASHIQAIYRTSPLEFFAEAKNSLQSNEFYDSYNQLDQDCPASLPTLSEDNSGTLTANIAAIGMLNYPKLVWLLQYSVFKDRLGRVLNSNFDAIEINNLHESIMKGLLNRGSSMPVPEQVQTMEEYVKTLDAVLAPTSPYSKCLSSIGSIYDKFTEELNQVDIQIELLTKLASE